MSLLLLLVAIIAALFAPSGRFSDKNSEELMNCRISVSDRDIHPPSTDEKVLWFLWFWFNSWDDVVDVVRTDQEIGWRCPFNSWFLWITFFVVVAFWILKVVSIGWRWWYCCCKNRSGDDVVSRLKMKIKTRVFLSFCMCFVSLRVKWEVHVQKAESARLWPSQMVPRHGHISNHVPHMQSEVIKTKF